MDFSIIIQARMGSTRLPSKTMLKIKNKPLLDYVYNQVSQSKKISKIIIATTTLSEDNLISDYATSKNISVYRGDSQNVLDRFFQCAKKVQKKCKKGANFSSKKQKKTMLRYFF